jgi:tetratricopeptide (TPR) repeat protein
MPLHIALIVTIMIVAGIFGGLVSHAMSDSKQTGGLRRSIVIGVGASLLVPVFLDMISSDLVVSSTQNPDRLLVFAGFCLIASIFSRKFITTISNKLIEEKLEKVDRKIEKMEQSQELQNLLNDCAFYIENKNFDVALRTFDEIIAKYPASSRPYLGKARTYRLLGQIDQAIQMATEAIARSDENKYKGYYNRACYKAISGKHEAPEIIKDLEIAISLHPKYAQFASSDRDLESIKDESLFKELISSHGTKTESET